MLPQSNIGKDAYNNFNHIPDFAYNCVSFLMGNELVWKLLKYNDPDAWRDDVSHPNLTKTEKGALIYAGQEEESLYKVFLDSGQDNVWTTEATVLRIAPYEIYPENRTVGTVNVLMEVYSHYKINHLSNYRTRTVWITQQLISLFNGTNIGGIGNLFYNRQGSQSIRTYTAGQTPMKGFASLFSTKEG